jgi:RNA polymerase sigma-70 factor (ECF subfamily)
VVRELCIEAALQVADNPARRAEYTRVFEQCLSDILQELPLRDRTILQMSLVQGASIDVIARVYGRHRANVARWLVHARERLRHDFKQRLATLLGRLDESEFQSLVRLVRSEMAVSWSVLMEPAPDQG